LKLDFLVFVATTKQQWSNGETEQQSNRSTEQQSNRATEQQSNRATKQQPPHNHHNKQKTMSWGLISTLPRL
jgi:hypothetical protein